jgi:hypothetical protein
LEKRGVARGAARSLLDNRPLLLRGCPKLPPLQNSPSSSCPHFFVHVNSCWLATELACPTKLLLNFLFPHNFWSIGPKIMKFVLLQSLYRGACSQKVSKNLKIKWDQVTLPKLPFVHCRDNVRLGVNELKFFQSSRWWTKINWNVNLINIMISFHVTCTFWLLLTLKLSVKYSYPVCFPLLFPPHPLLYCVLTPLQPPCSHFWANWLFQYSLLRT